WVFVHLTSQQLMPYPLDPLREPIAPVWSRYDHLMVRERLDAITDETDEDKGAFEAFLSTFGGVAGSETGWAESLRW
ncbi:hypothetical protein Micbo1qcDRAFT_169626, partial [Microdochium bolleyi]